jgi:hypothetical protein
MFENQLVHVPVGKKTRPSCRNGSGGRYISGTMISHSAM